MDLTNRVYALLRGWMVVSKVMHILELGWMSYLLFDVMVGVNHAKWIKWELGILSGVLLLLYLLNVLVAWQFVMRQMRSYRPLAYICFAIGFVCSMLFISDMVSMINEGPVNGELFLLVLHFVFVLDIIMHNYLYRKYVYPLYARVRLRVIRYEVKAMFS